MIVNYVSINIQSINKLQQGITMTKFVSKKVSLTKLMSKVVRSLENEGHFFDLPEEILVLEEKHIAMNLSSQNLFAVACYSKDPISDKVSYTIAVCDCFEELLESQQGSILRHELRHIHQLHTGMWKMESTPIGVVKIWTPTGFQIEYDMLMNSKEIRKALSDEVSAPWERDAQKYEFERPGKWATFKCMTKGSYRIARYKRRVNSVCINEIVIPV